MKLADVARMSGHLRIWVRKNGELVEKMDEHNLIVDNAKTVMAHLAGGDVASRSIAKVAFGTNGTAPAASDSSITDPYEKQVDAVEYPQSGQVTFHFSLGSSEANGKQIREFGLLCADGTLFARRIRSEALAKEQDITIDGEWTIAF